MSRRNAYSAWLRKQPVSSVGLDLFSGGTFTRSSDASYVSDGSILIAPTNVRRIEGGMLVLESARTNTVRRSQPSPDTGWSRQGFTTAAFDSVAGPLGPLTAATVNLGAFPTAGLITTQTTAPADNAIMLVSAWVRADAPTFIRLQARQKDGETYVYSDDLPVGITWTRVDAALSAGVGASTPLIGLANATAGMAQTIYATAFQCEVGVRWPSSYVNVPGTTQQTRAADTLTYAAGEYPASLTSVGGRITFALQSSSAEYVAAGGGGVRPIYLPGATNTSIQLVPQSGANIAVRLYDANVSRVARTISIANRNQPITIEWRVGAESSLTISGATTGDGTSTGAGTTAWGTETGIQIGANSFFGRFGRYIEAL